jgi:hypothetical protein
MGGVVVWGLGVKEKKIKGMQSKLVNTAYFMLQYGGTGLTIPLINH